LYCHIILRMALDTSFGI